MPTLINLGEVLNLKKDEAYALPAKEVLCDSSEVLEYSSNVNGPWLNNAAKSYPSLVVSDGAVAYWRLNETSGTTVKSLAGNIPDGTIVGGVTLNQTGALTDNDKAMQFNGTTGRINLGSVPALNITGDLTIEAWIKPTSDGTYRMIVVNQEAPNRNSPFELRLNGGNSLEFIIANTATLQTITSTAVANIGSYHHIVIVKTSTTVTFFVDNILTDSKPITLTPTAANTTAAIGVRGSDSFGYFNGFIDEVAIYNRALTLQQIQSHYEARLINPKQSSSKGGFVKGSVDSKIICKSY